MEVRSLFESYKLENLVFQNERASVFAGKVGSSEEPVFIKRQMKNSEKAKQNPFQDLLKINHKLIANCVDVFEYRGFFYAVYMRPPGEPLINVLRKFGKLREDDVAKIAGQVLKAVDYLHSIGLSLIEISISTVFYEEKSRDIQIFDWNYSCDYKSEHPYSQFPNPKQYSPPELFEYGQFLSSLADSWAVGILVHTLLSGGFPWGSIPHIDSIPSIISYPPQLPNNITASCAHFLQRTIEIESSRRYSIQQCLSHLWIVKVNKKVLRRSMGNIQCSSAGSCSDFLRNSGACSILSPQYATGNSGLKKIPRRGSLTAVQPIDTPLSFNTGI
jgi:serine/threonine protein kinase